MEDDKARHTSHLLLITDSIITELLLHEMSDKVKFDVIGQYLRSLCRSLVNACKHSGLGHRCK